MKKVLLSMALSLGLATSAFAADGPLSYDYVQATAVHDHDTKPANGADVKASVEVGYGLFVQGDASRLQLHGEHADRYQAGLGYHYDFSRVSVYGLASVVSVDSNQKGVSEKYGYDGEVGVRVALTQELEVGAAVEHQKLNLDSTVRDRSLNYGKLSADYFLSKHLALVAEYRAAKVDHQAGVGVRWTW